MATMRGRKRTDDPTPNRARDIQRAFRARRAAHLESLEQRIRELDEENNYLRKLLNLPSAHRPPLGKGPTGRGVAKSRSRLNGDGLDKQCGSPEPPSDTSSTPPIDYPIGLPTGAMDGYPSLMSGNIDGLTSSMGSHSTPEVKLLNEFTSPEIYTDNILPTPGQQYHDMDGPAPILPFGYSGETPWAINPETPLNHHNFPTEVTPTIDTPRYYMFPPQTAPSPRTNGSVTQLHPASNRSMGHRRSHTEPQSIGSVLPPFSPTHRSSNSQTFVTVVRHDLSPSPPPLPIRSTVQSFR